MFSQWPRLGCQAKLSDGGSLIKCNSQTSGFKWLFPLPLRSNEPPLTYECARASVLAGPDLESCGWVGANSMPTILVEICCTSKPAPHPLALVRHLVGRRLTSPVWLLLAFLFHNVFQISIWPSRDLTKARTGSPQFGKRLVPKNYRTKCPLAFFYPTVKSTTRFGSLRSCHTLSAHQNILV